MNKIFKVIIRWKGSYLLYLLFFTIGCAAGVFIFKGKTKSFIPGNAEFLEVFLNNINVGLLLFIGGLFTGGTIAFFIIITNGFIVGNVIHIAIASGSLKTLFTGLIPHFLFELFGLLSFAVLGSFTGYIIIKFLSNKMYEVNYRILIMDGILIMTISVASLLLGAIVEDYISIVNFIRW